MSRDPNDNKGVVLILMLVLMATAILLTAAYLDMTKYGVLHLDGQASGVHAQYIAEAGLNKAVWYLLNTAPDNSTDGSWRTSAYPAAFGPSPADPQQESFGNGSYIIWVQDNDGHIQVTSRGVYNGTARTVHEMEDWDGAGLHTLNRVAGSWRSEVL